MEFDFDNPQSDTEFETFSPEFEFPQLDAEFPAFESDITPPFGAVTPPFSILSESGVSTPSEAETIRHQILPSTTCNITSMAPPAAGRGPEDEDQTQAPHEEPEPLKVDTNSCLAGYSYETSQGRYIVFYWQSESRASTPGGIYLSTFAATNLSWTLLHEPYLVASTARQGTPLAAVNWSNGLKGAVYFLDQRNLLCERVTQDGGKTWDDGMLTKQCLAARANSDIAADVIWEEMDKLQIFVYFQGGGRNGIRQLKSSGHFPETKWVEDTGNNYNTLKALSGTSIICGHDFFCCDKQWIYTQSQAKEVQKHRLKNGSWEISATKYFTGSFDRKVRLGYCADSRLRRIYLHDGSQVTERTRPRHHTGDWNAQTLLPSGTGIPRIGHNFVVLQWAQDVDDTASQIHLFSLLDGKLQDYVVGLASGASYSLVD